MFNKVEVFGEVPLARFGHTITQGNPIGKHHLICEQLESNSLFHNSFEV